MQAVMDLEGGTPSPIPPPPETQLPKTWYVPPSPQKVCSCQHYPLPLGFTNPGSAPDAHHVCFKV